MYLSDNGESADGSIRMLDPAEWMHLENDLSRKEDPQYGRLANNKSQDMATTCLPILVAKV